MLAAVIVASVLGTWGGDHVSLELTAEGGTVEFDCAHGTISRPIALDASGRFDVPGTYVEERGGPVRENAAATSVAVRYTGRVRENRMQLVVARRDTKERLGTFALTRGQEPFLVKCR